VLPVFVPKLLTYRCSQQKVEPGPPPSPASRSYALASANDLMKLDVLVIGQAHITLTHKASPRGAAVAASLRDTIYLIL
jgi:hypothetical protein